MGTVQGPGCHLGLMHARVALGTWALLVVSRCVRVLCCAGLFGRVVHKYEVLQRMFHVCCAVRRLMSGLSSTGGQSFLASSCSHLATSVWFACVVDLVVGTDSQ